MAGQRFEWQSLKSKRILITSGPTWVSIDPMRVISNRATGELGKILTRALVHNGAKVTLLEGPVTKPLSPAKNVTIKKFSFYEELKDLLKTELRKKYDVVIHNAAVSDYHLKKPYRVKLNSGQKTLMIELFPTEKLINTIKRLSPKVFLVGFKLEDFQNKKEIRAESKKLIDSAGCNLVVANTLKGGYLAFLVNRDYQILNQSRSRAELTKNLISKIKEMI